MVNVRFGVGVELAPGMEVEGVVGVGVEPGVEAEGYA
jgi:hypothetical protein